MRTTIIALAAYAAVVVGCSAKAEDNKDSAAAPAAAAAVSRTTAPRADSGYTADLRDSTGREIGTLTLSDVAGGIMIMGNLRGLTPGVHGIHLHMMGMCAPNFAAAGAHWNPANKEHGKDNPKGPHMGDLMNINVNADGTAAVMLTSPGGTLTGTDMLLDSDGATVVIHAKADDYKSQPAGNSGDRVACGVVKMGQ